MNGLDVKTEAFGFVFTNEIGHRMTIRKGYIDDEITEESDLDVFAIIIGEDEFFATREELKEIMLRMSVMLGDVAP